MEKPFSALVLVLALILSACSGGDGANGAAGAKGPAGPTMPVIQSLYATGSPAASGGTITATVQAQSAQDLALTYAWSASDGWTIASGDTTSIVTITAPNTVGASGTATVVVTDSGGLQATGTVALNTAADGAPVAAPGADQCVLPGTLVWLDGSGSFDPNGDSLTYAWSMVSTPSSTATLSNAAVVNPDFYADAPGRYVISLTVNDGLLSSATKTVTVTARIPVPDSGQTVSYTSTFGEDSDYKLYTLSYTDNGEGTIRDNVTGLTWQKCSAGQTNDAACSGTATSYNWFEASGTYDATYNASTVSVCGSLALAGGGWRLPTSYELVTLVDYGAYNTAINAVSFPNNSTSFYWSSTSVAAVPTSAWYVIPSGGSLTYGDKTVSGKAVRCVR